jgi:hypothetical protein
MLRAYRLLLAFLSLSALAWVPFAASSQSEPRATLGPAPIAALGIALPAVGGWHWLRMQKKYFTPAVMEDIRDNLHASYVRTGWIPDWFKFEDHRWHREDEGLDAICSSGLQAAILVPSPKDDAKGEDDLVNNVGEFFARYAKREFGCLRYAEIVNEADLPANGFTGVNDYARFYERVAPMISAFGIPVITSGTSGMDRPWTTALALLLSSSTPIPSVSGYGFHPYGVAPRNMARAVAEMRAAADATSAGALPDVYVTEIGLTDPSALYQTIVNLARATPAITIYEYMTLPNEKPSYALKENPALYAAVQRAWSAVTAGALTYPSRR